MNINKTNYGIWFLDYYEEHLAAEQVAELFLFLEQHPELRDEFEAFSQVKLIPDEVLFSDKEQLKRNTVTPGNIDHFLIGEIENDLTLAERTTLRNYLKDNPAVENDRQLFRKTKLTPTSETFPDKKLLKKKVIPFYSITLVRVAAAAIVILILGILFINRPEDKINTAQIDTTKTNTPGNEPKEKRKSISDDFINGNLVAEDNINKTETIQPVLIEEKKKIIKEEITVADNFRNVKGNGGNPYKNSSKKSAIKNEEQLLAAERKENLVFVSTSVELSPVKSDETALAGNLSLPYSRVKTTNEKLDDLKNLAVNKVNGTTGEEILYNTYVTDNPAADKVPLKSRMIKLVAWAVSTISGDHIKVETTLDRSGNIAAYEVSAGKLRYERNF